MDQKRAGSEPATISRVAEAEIPADLMHQVQALMQNDGPLVQPFWRTFSTVMDKKVKGFSVHPSQYIFANQYAVTA